MKGILLRVTLVVLLLALATSTADAQRRARRAAAASAGVRWGPHIGYNFDVEELLIGAQVSWGLTPQLDLYPTFDYYFVDGVTLWALNFDVKYRPPTRYGAWYVGGGLNLTHASAGGTGNSDTNLNLLTGLEGRRGRTRPYAEARFILGDGSSFQIVGGFSVR
ncbi:MAG TPA: hypothetical protein VF978_03555 [Gemmatimonadales bacterium]